MIGVSAGPGPDRPTNEDRIRAALWFAERGFGVFSVWSTWPDGRCRCPKGASCSSAGKHPVTDGLQIHGFQDATQDPARIRALLSAGSSPNYGLVCPDGVFAWDADGPDWKDRIHRLEERHGALPDTLRTATAHGEHQFWRWPDRIGERPEGEMFGFVTRWGTGSGAGYVIGPRSVHSSGAVYSPAEGSKFEIADLPDRWAAAASGTDVPLRIVVSEGYVLPDRVSEGERYNSIVSYTAHLYNREIAPSEMWPLVRDILAPRFTVPLSESDLRDRFDRAVAGMDRRLGEPRSVSTPDSETGESRSRRGNDELGLLGLPESTEFPPPPREEAFEGDVGQLVAELLPGTDASRVAILGAMLAFCGALVPGHADWQGDNTSSPFIALVGESGVGRKGTAMRRVKVAMRATFGKGAIDDLLLAGINSGEGLVNALVKGVGRTYNVRLVYEEEYASMLASRQREGSNLDPKMRTAFDGEQLSNIRSNDQKVVPAPYWLPAIIAITPTELQDRIEPNAGRTGSANRWLYLPVVQRDVLSDDSPARFSTERERKLRVAQQRCSDTTNPLTVAPGITVLLGEYERFLRKTTRGIGQDLSKRLHVIAFRIGLIHALVEAQLTVSMEHVWRGICLTEYSRAGLSWAFRAVSMNPDADLLYRHLVHEGGLSRNAITREFIREPKRRQAAMDDLQRLRLARIDRTPTRGRPREMFVPLQDEGTFVHFVPTSDVRNPQPLDEMDEMDETTQMPWTKAGRKLDETGRKSPAEAGT